MKKFILLVTVYWMLAAVLSGCATVPRREALPTYSLNGSTYVALVSLCEPRDIALDYDTFTRAVSLKKGSHRIDLKVGEGLVVVDGRPNHMGHPVDLYQGTVVVPYKFKEDIIDALFPSSYRERVSRVQLNIKKVVLDAGHGGHDPGAIGRSGLREKEINLDIARRVASLLRNEGVQVVLTRPSDKYIPLGTRVRIANDSRADIFVSIHSNANPVRSLNGFEVYYVAPSVSDSKRALFAARSSNLELEGAVFASRSPTLKAILWDMIYTCARAESIELADAICKSTDSELNVEVLGVKGARYEVLRGAQMPAVLIEVGFLSNSNEESKLRNSFYRQKIAEAIVGGITDYAQDASSMEVVKR